LLLVLPNELAIEIAGHLVVISERPIVGIYKCKWNMKDSANAHNTIVAFYREYSSILIYIFTGKQWSKDLLGNKGVSINIPT
jgi:hypothetical protein